MELVSVQCPNCGADLPARAPVGGYTCDYCNGQFQINQARSAKTMAGAQIDVNELAQAIVTAQREQQNQPPSMGGPSRLPGQGGAVNYGAPAQPMNYQAQMQAQAYAQAQAAKAAGAGRRLGCIITAVTLLGTLVPAVIIAVTQAGLPDIPGLGSVGESMEYLLWDHSNTKPLVVKIGGRPAFIGRTQKPLSEQELNLDLYYADTVERGWRIGPLGSYTEAYQHAFFAAAGDRLAVSDAKAQVHIHELATGERVQTISLTDKVGYLCAPKDAKTKVFVAQIDEKTHLLDLQTGKLEESGVPAGCHKTAWEAQSADEEVKTEDAPEIEGMDVKKILIKGGLGVALGVKTPGTPVPRIVGFDPKDKSIKWDGIVSSVDPATVRNEDLHAGMSDGRVFVTYGAGQEDWYLTAFDAKAGTRIWEQKLRPLFAVDWIQGMTAMPTHVLVGRTSSMEVYEAKTGELVGMVGKETYD